MHAIPQRHDCAGVDRRESADGSANLDVASRKDIGRNHDWNNTPGTGWGRAHRRRVVWCWRNRRVAQMVRCRQAVADELLPQRADFSIT